MQAFNESQLHELAKKRVEFRRHLTVYFVINSVLWIVWYLTGGEYMWPLWPMAGWGVGVTFHYLFEYRTSNLFSEEEEFKKLKKYIEEQK